MRERNAITIKILIWAAMVTWTFMQPFSTVKAHDRSEVSNVLILHSYHEGFSWTREENAGILERFYEESNRNIIVMTEYLDWKNHPTERNLSHFYEHLKYKYHEKSIDVIITTDDKALEFALEHRQEIFSSAPIVFAGVNANGYKEIIGINKDVTGVLEIIDPTETITFALEWNPDVRKVYLVYDNTESGLSTGEIVTKTIKTYNSDIEIIPCNDKEFETLYREVETLDPDSIVFVTTYYRDVNMRLLDLEYVTQVLSYHSSVPVYHLYDFGVRNGALGGITISGREQGRYAAHITLQILDGYNVNDIAVIKPKNTKTIFDYKQMQRFGLKVKELPSNSEILNRPFSFYETYKNLVLIVLISFGVLLVFLVLLLLYIRNINRMKKRLADSNEELTQLYEELAASDEEMREQYHDMIVIHEKMKEGEEKLSYLAYHDDLTGLPNKVSLFERASTIFQGDEPATLLFLDIDNFKYVNDSLGHGIGDLLIKQVSVRLKEILDCQDCVYRLSGDEFIVVLQDIKNVQNAEAIATYILDQFTQVFLVEGNELHISLSMGLVMYPDHGRTIEELLTYGDIAMYKVKTGGRKNYMVYDHPMHEVFIERVAIEKHLHHALENKEFEVHYQPQFNSYTKKMTGVEALLRWRNPTLGYVPPLKFIHISEDTRDIIPIGSWVLESSCEFLRQLIDLGYDDMTVSVNISIIQLIQADFCSLISGMLVKYQIAPKQLELEITETMLIESFETIIDILQQLHQMGISLALDDFGKGYSSLNYLKQLPINTLKVDKSFIDPIIEPDKDTLAGQIVMLGKSMGMCVIAEGVERIEQLEYLRKYNCDKIQGYLFSKPIAPNEVITMLKEI